jgi:PTS system nitrogen regulatory IIA component
MHFGATLRLLRLESGLSLRDLARRLSVSSTYLSRVEKGQDSVPTAARLEAIARELSIPATLLMSLAHRVSPLVVDYVQEVPEAGTLFLEIAHRRLSARQLLEVRDFINERFPVAGRLRPRVRGVSELLAPDRIILGLTCSTIDDVIDVAAGRLAALSDQTAAEISAPLRAREREVSSAIGSGVALTCAYLAHDAPAAVLVTLARPLMVDAPDALPLRMMVVLAGPRDLPDRRLHLAHLAHLTARGLSERLGDVTSAEEVLARLAVMEASN